MHRGLRLLRSLVATAALFAAACGGPTELTFLVGAPPNPLLDPFGLAVSDYVLKTDDGAIVAAVSAGAGRDGDGRLGLGPLDPTLAADLRLDVLSGAQLLGRARVRGVAIAGGAAHELDAEVRKPLVVVGAATAPEGGGVLQPPQLFDPTTSTDLTTRGLSVPGGEAAVFTGDGRTLIATSAQGLSAFDTGTGATRGLTALPFPPALLAITRDDGALALIERGGTSSRVLLYADLAALLAGTIPAAVTATIASGVPRAAHFSASGDMLYVLVEDSGSEPCTGAVPPPSRIVPVDRGGRVGAPIALPSYVADFAVDRAGRLVLAETSADDISILTLTTADGSGGVGAPVRLYSATCPTALRLLDDQVFAFTNDATAGGNDFSLLRGRLDGSLPVRLSIPRPTYEHLLNTSSTRDKLTRLQLEFVSFAVSALEMAVSPDGSRAVIATRARYREDGKQAFDFVGLTCTATVDIVEHGLFSVDLVAGAASYVARSQSTIVPARPLTDPCVRCEEDLGGGNILSLNLRCPSAPGDRAAGLAAAFSGAP